MRAKARIAAALAAALACMPAGGRAAEVRPARIASIELCTDILLVLLAPRDRIASVTFLAADPSLSPVADRVAGLRLNHGLAEEVLSLAPDLVLAGPYAAQVTVALLRGLGLRVEVVRPARSFAEIRAAVREAARLVGEPAAGEALVERMDDALARVPPPAQPRPSAALYQSNGYTQGAGTLVDAVLRAAGLANLGAEDGRQGTARLDIETLLMHPPDLLVREEGSGAPSLAAAFLRHPALRALARRTLSVTIPGNLWTCGTPFAADAVGRLAAARPR